MELWLDTIDANLIEHTAQRLSLTGITTNPSILAKTDSSFKDTVSRLLTIQPGMLAVQVTAPISSDMIKQAERIASYSKRIIIKIPVTEDGLHAIKVLADNKIATMATAIFEPRQVLLSTLAGAAYAAPYFGRMGDTALITLEAMQKMITVNNYPLKLIAAAIRNVDQLMALNILGVQATTIPEAVIKELIANYPLTQNSLAKFNEDWKSRVNQSLDLNNI